jgi:hypothetical protein
MDDNQNSELLVTNQETIKGNQGSIKNNQDTILKGQGVIKTNQDSKTLELIVKNQQTIVKLLKKK